MEVNYNKSTIHGTQTFQEYRAPVIQQNGHEALYRLEQAIGQLERLVAQGAVSATQGQEAADELRAENTEARTTNRYSGRLANAGRKALELLQNAGGAADDITTIGAAVTVISGMVL
jgi:hypothetical protein